MLLGRTAYRIDVVLSRGVLKWVTWSHLCGRAQTFTYLAYHVSCLLFDFYPFEDLEVLFISIPSSSSSKTDFISLSCCIFYVGGFTALCFLERSNSLLVTSSSLNGLWFFSAWSCRGFCCDSNEPKNIEKGVWMMKICSFSCLVFLQFS